ncbi:uncharacterized protein BDW70DRAFT_154277 [Aspergillus foveolatus]|uniref:uncharacterized protein n=1 Tax=Aspergillus foveolatus TaxID=210207 RepID=UPI003CCD2472
METAPNHCQRPSLVLGVFYTVSERKALTDSRKRLPRSSIDSFVSLSRSRKSRSQTRWLLGDFQEPIAWLPSPGTAITLDASKLAFQILLWLVYRNLLDTQGTMAASKQTQVVKPPFPVRDQLSADLDAGSLTRQYLPGYPLIQLQDQYGLLNFLEREYCSTDLDQMADKLWWMSKQDCGNISPLHRQYVKGRTIIVTEDPKLHLIWIHNRIFVKPLPQYITSYAFWRDYLQDDAKSPARDHYRRVRQAALGFLRTYLYLVRSESDFYIAQEPSLHLIAKDVTWEQFCNFATHLTKISNKDVSGRYAYGEIRLTRLNFYAPLLLRKWNFQRVQYQYGEYFARFYGPILFVAGAVSILLSGLQVTIAIQETDPALYNRASLVVSFWFSAVVMLCFGSILMILFFTLVYKVVKEWKYAIRDRLRLLEEGQPEPPTD